MDNYQLYITTYTLNITNYQCKSTAFTLEETMRESNELSPTTVEGIGKIEAEGLPLILQQ